MENVKNGYSGLQIMLHWLIAVLFAFNYFFGGGMGRIFDTHLGNAPTPFWPGMVHVYVGIAVLVLTGLRIYVRRRTGAPKAATGGAPWMALASVWTHRIIYALLVIVPAFGMMAWYLDIQWAGDLHVYSMNALLGLVGLHAVAAIYHQYVLRDGLIRRMIMPS